MTEDCRLDDHRRIVGGTGVNREEFLDGWKMVADVGFDKLAETTIAIRGASLSIQQGIASGSHGFEVGAVVLAHTDTSGRICFAAYFEPEDLDAAFAELDSRWIATGEPSELAKIAIGTVEALNSRDWDRLASFMTEDYVNVDHRPVSSGTREGRDAYIHWLRAATDVTTDRRVRLVNVLRADGGGEVLHYSQSGTSELGFAAEWDDLRVGVVRQGKIARAEIFPFDRLEEATARADELTVT